MHNVAAGVGGRWRMRGLYLVPERRVIRAAHVPAGRTLHLLDLENLMGGPCQGHVALSHAVASYRDTASVQANDHVVIAVNPALALQAGDAWPKARLLLGLGPHGSDEALLRSVSDREWTAARYDRVIIGSGDHIFADLALSFRELGIAVGVVAPRDRLSRQLRRSATFVRTFTVLPSLQIVA